MKTHKQYNVITAIARLLPAGLVAATLVLSGPAFAKDLGGRAEVVRPTEKYQGRSYGDWAAAWQEWAIGLPALPGHPNFDDGNFDITDGQSGAVWFLAAPFGTVERSGTVPKHTALFIALLNAEVSNLESDPFFGATEADQRAQVDFLVDHIVNPFFIIDGKPLKKIGDYRVASPQYSFYAPDPNILGVPAGSGTSVTDGYWVLVEPMEKGEHTIQYGGAFHFSVAEGDPFDLDVAMDMTYHLTVK
jgi:hypothetical protein